MHSLRYLLAPAVAIIVALIGCSAETAPSEEGNEQVIGETASAYTYGPRTTGCVPNTQYERLYTQQLVRNYCIESKGCDSWGSMGWSRSSCASGYVKLTYKCLGC